VTVSSAHELYALDPQEFVRERDALAKQLRASGDRDEAARVKALRRPTVAAWAINQVAREQPHVVSALVDAAADARRGHDVRQALVHRRDAIARVMRAVREVLAESGRDRDAHDRDVEELLNNLAGSEASADILRRGELSGGEGAAPGDDDLLASLTASVPEGAPTRDDEPAREPAPPKPSPALRRARDALADREEQLQEAEQRVEVAQAALDRAVAARDKARDAVADARRRVDELS
jgi:hypothetical protein